MSTSYVSVTDLFCGAGGSSLGAVAGGAELRWALNHWPLAIKTHNHNFPAANHDCTDISACNPKRYDRTDILIASPECTNHSLAKGAPRKTRQLSLLDNGQPDPAAERSRATMWDVPRFAEVHRYPIIVVENVPDARHWELWDAWLMAMRLLGYDHRPVYFNSMFAHPTPQSRDRMYVVFWRRGNRAPDLDFAPPARCERCDQDVASVQSWKNPRKPWGKYRQQYVYRCPICAAQVEPYYYAAANAIDWQLPAERIGDRKRPLKEKTLARIRYGLEKFARQPYMVGTSYTHEIHHRRSYPVDGPLTTQTSRQDVGLCVPPFIAELRAHSTARELTEPLATMCAGGGHHGLTIPPGWMVMNYSPGYVRSIDGPLGSVTTSDHHALLTAPWLTSYYSGDGGHSLSEALPTVTTRDRHALVCPPFIASQYGGRHAVRSVEAEMPTTPGMAVHYLAQPGALPEVDDCGFRMLFPHEVGAAMAFPSTYIVHGTKRDQIKQYGNGVTPPVMRWIMQRCLATLGG